MNHQNQLPLQPPKLRTSNLKRSPTSTSLLSRTRKISSELKLSRPLKRATSLSYRVFTPTEMEIPQLSQSQPLIKPKTTYGRRLKKRFKFLRRLSVTPDSSTFYNLPISASSSSSSLNSSSSIHQPFTVDTFVVTPQPLASPPSSPRENADYDDDDDDDDEESDTSCFSNNSGDCTRDTSYNHSSSCESSPLSKKNLTFKPILGDLFKPETLVHSELTTELIDLENSQLTNTQTHAIFQIPEILELILRNVAYDDVKSIPTEPKMHRRPPLSYNHSLLMYGEENGKKIWERTTTKTTITNLSLLGDKNGHKNPNLYNCLFVNKQWHHTIISILNENLHFQSDKQFTNFTNSIHDKPQPFSLIFHKVKTTQSAINCFSNQISSRRLNWLEFYICPNILPPISFATPSLQKLVLPGCKMLNDDHLKLLVSKAPFLKHLDIRACDQITDSSLYYIAHNCPQLELLNCGRHSRGELISDISIGLIAKNCSIKTIGLAGCGISNWSIWEIAIHCGSTLERISLNYCWKLTDVGICKLVKTGLLDNVSVLEIRGLQLTNVKELVLWKRKLINHSKKILIEACENIDSMIQKCEEQIDLEAHGRMLQNMEQWNNDEVSIIA